MTISKIVLEGFLHINTDEEILMTAHPVPARKLKRMERTFAGESIIIPRSQVKQALQKGLCVKKVIVNDYSMMYKEIEFQAMWENSEPTIKTMHVCHN